MQMEILDLPILRYFFAVYKNDVKHWQQWQTENNTHKYMCSPDNLNTTSLQQCSNTHLELISS